MPHYLYRKRIQCSIAWYCSIHVTKEEITSDFELFIRESFILTARDKSASPSKRERKGWLGICFLSWQVCSNVAGVMLLCFSHFILYKSSDFHSRYCSDYRLVGFDIVQYVRWCQCFRVTHCLHPILWRNRVQVDNEVISVRMWCNCMSRLQQIRVVRCMGKREERKGDGVFCVLVS